MLSQNPGKGKCSEKEGVGETMFNVAETSVTGKRKLDCLCQQNLGPCRCWLKERTKQQHGSRTGFSLMREWLEGMDNRKCKSENSKCTKHVS